MNIPAVQACASEGSRARGRAAWRPASGRCRVPGRSPLGSYRGESASAGSSAPAGAAQSSAWRGLGGRACAQAPGPPRRALQPDFAHMAGQPARPGTLAASQVVAEHRIEAVDGRHQAHIPHLHKILGRLRAPPVAPHARPAESRWRLTSSPQAAARCALADGSVRMMFRSSRSFSPANT